MKEFNTTGGCNPADHYMVDISQRLKEIRALVNEGKYFCINRARQYGKTTTMQALAEDLRDEYIVIAFDFQDIGSGVYESEGTFTKGLARLLIYAKELSDTPIPDHYVQELNRIIKTKADELKMDEMFFLFRRWCKASEKKIVLMIDEVDTASNNQVFLDFLAQLRSGYLKRKTIRTFQSVILAGVTDVKHLKAKIRPEEAHRENSPWNIAADFNIDMSLSEEGIRGMLEEYEADHHTGMDTAVMAKSLREYTAGYPYLVSRLCQLMAGPVSAQMGLLQADGQTGPSEAGGQAGLSESSGQTGSSEAGRQTGFSEAGGQAGFSESTGQAGLSGAALAWTGQGLDEAVKIVLADSEDTLFSSLMGKLQNMPQLKGQLRDILMKGDVISWRPDDQEQSLLRMYGFIINSHNSVIIANRIFEMRLYQFFLGESQNQKNDAYRSDALLNKSIFINNDRTLNMPLILEHFIDTQRRVYGDADDRFLEEEGRERFLTYLAPIINGTGTYSIEEQTRDKLRMDVVIHYLGKRYVVELKIWRGPRYNEDGEKQIMEYLDYFGLSTGYMVSFNFNKKKKRGVERVSIGNKVLFEATV